MVDFKLNCSALFQWKFDGDKYFENYLEAEFHEALRTINDLRQPVNKNK